jgi:hypothetical protein
MRNIFFIFTIVLFLPTTGFALEISVGTPLKIIEGAEAMHPPFIICREEGELWLITVKSTVDGAEEIHYHVSKDGVKWTAEERLTFSKGIDDQPTGIIANDGRIWLFFRSSRDTAYDPYRGNTEIYYKVFNGTWSDDNRLTNSLGGDFSPSAVQSEDGRIWVAWTTDRDGIENFSVYYKIYDGNWSEDTRLTEGQSSAIIQAPDGKILLIFKKGLDVYSSYFFNGHWSQEKMLIATMEKDYTGYPVITRDAAGRLWLIYSARRGGYKADTYLYYKVSTDNGDTWTEEKALYRYKGQPASFLDRPSACVTQGKLWLTWSEYQPKEDMTEVFEIYVASVMMPEPRQEETDERVLKTTKPEKGVCGPTLITLLAISFAVFWKVRSYLSLCFLF